MTNLLLVMKSNPPVFTDNIREATVISDLESDAKTAAVTTTVNGRGAAIDYAEVRFLLSLICLF